MSFRTVLLVLAVAGCSRGVRLPASIPAAQGKPRVAYALRVLDLVQGTGAAAEPRQCYFVHYTGWLTDGTKFDSSRDTTAEGRPKEPIAFPQGARLVVPGWDAGAFDGMHVGGQRRLFIPYQLAYGERGRPPVIPPRAELVFDVELMAVADTLARTDSTPPRRRADFYPRCPTWAQAHASDR